MMSLTNLGLTLDPMVRTLFALFLCIFTIMLVVLVFWGLMFSHQQDSITKVIFLRLTFFYQQESIPKVVDSLKMLALKFLIFFPNLIISFILIVVVILCLAHSDCCSFTKNMIRPTPMGTICRPSDYGSGCTGTTAFIQYTNGRDPQINKLWCQDFDGIFREVRPTERVDILDGTVGYFVTNYLAENGCQIRIIGEISVNGSVQFLGLSNQAWGSGLLYIANLLAVVEATGWVNSNDSNQIWRGRFKGGCTGTTAFIQYTNGRDP